MKRTSVLIALLGLMLSAPVSATMPRYQGMNLIVRPDYDVVAQMRAIRRLGATDVALVLRCNQSGTSLTCEQADWGILKRARTMGLRVWVKPHVETTEFSWRGAITFQTPAEWDTWWQNYRAMLYPLADLNPDVLVIGTELNSMTSQASEWRKMAREVRSRCRCTVLYAANYDDVGNVQWWDAVDAIGVDVYYPLQSPDAAMPNLVTAWRPFVKTLDDVAGKWHKRVVFTEIGYQSRVGSYLSPAQKDPSIISQSDQANAYRAAFRVFSQKVWWGGALWWDWNPNDDGSGFTPSGKLAEGVLRGWWGSR